MKNIFPDDNFLLHSKAAEELYHGHAANMPIFDYHCHLSPRDIAEDRIFENLTQAWLEGDHYKWRAMRANGVAEDFITGKMSDREKFKAWAATVPYTLRNPLFDWVHLELSRYFGIQGRLLDETTADDIYDNASAQLNSSDGSVRKLLLKMNVRTICTTDDPVDDLQFHKQLASEDFGINMLPTFRPDKAMALEDVATFNSYLDRLGEASGIDIRSFPDMLQALAARHDYFHETGCRIADHSLPQAYAEDVSDREAGRIFDDARSGRNVCENDVRKMKSILMLEIARMHASRGWTMQIHLGVLRNPNSRRFRELGPDTGFDAMDDLPQARPLAKFLDRLESDRQLPGTIVYNINPSDNEPIATVLASFQDGLMPGKMQFGSGWWFLDQKNGMKRQMETLANMGLLSRFVGMVTDSRSFLSYPRHEYFRRVLCDFIGDDIERGDLPADMTLAGRMAEDICYGNAEEYFGCRRPEG